jgi:hypothetical protein
MSGCENSSSKPLNLFICNLAGALFAHRSFPRDAIAGWNAIVIDVRATELARGYSAAAMIFQFDVRSSVFLYM